MRPVKLTCHTSGCVNAETTLTLVTDAVQYLCGACNQFIEDAVEVIADAGAGETPAE